MKKLILAAALIFSIIGSSCTKENVAPASYKATVKADKANLAQCDLNAPIDPEAPCTPPNDKANLGQADGDN